MIRRCLLTIVLVAGCLSSAPVYGAQEKWQGVDEAVVEKIAREHGREARPPLTSTNHGELLPFFFLLAGVAGGFAGGYYWRKLTTGRRADRQGRR